MLAYLNSLLAIPAIIGFMALAYACVTLIYKTAEYFVLRNMAKEVYDLHAHHPDYVRSVITLPGASVFVAILAGVGINLATGDGGDGRTFAAGLTLMVVSLPIAWWLGFVMITTSDGQVGRARRALIRLARISTALEDPLRSDERLVLLIPEVRRLRATGKRLHSYRSNVKFRPWLRGRLSDTSNRAITIALYVMPAFSLLFVSLNVLDRETPKNSLFVYSLMAFLVAGGCSGLLSPILGWLNYQLRCRHFGSRLEMEANQVLRRLDSIQAKLRRNSMKAVPVKSAPEHGMSQIRRFIRRLRCLRGF